MALLEHHKIVASIWDVPHGRGPDDFRCSEDGQQWPCDYMQLRYLLKSVRDWLYAGQDVDDLKVVAVIDEKMGRTKRG